MDDLAANPLFQHSPVPMSVLDRNLRQVAANVKFYEVFGYPTESDLTSSDLTFSDDGQLTRDYIERVIAGDEAGSIEKRYVRADGSVFWGRVTAQPIDVGDEQLLLGVIEDVQAQHDLLESLAQSIQEANEQAEMRARFVAQVSHELRNPLHLIAGTSELIQRSDIPDRQRQQAASILAEATSLTALVDDLLDIGRGDAGQLTLDPTTFSVRSLVHRARQTVAAKADAKGLTLTTEVHDGVPVHALADEGRLRQVLVNLLSNAVKFTERGSVTLTVRNDPVGMTSFIVEDTGPGIPPEGLASVFEPFVRFSRDEAGAGLGLAIATRLAELMDGTLTVGNVEPHGAVFELRLPLPEVSGNDVPREATTTETPPSAGLETRTRAPLILIVEDSHENQMLATAQLEALGYRYELAADGFEALAALEAQGEEPFDAALMDWHMPGLNGLDTTRRIREIEEERGLARLPIIALTARAMTADVEACFDAGADDHIAKPAGLATLERVLARWTADESAEHVDQADDHEEIDRDALMALLDNLGDLDLVASIVESFLEQLEERVDRVISSDDPQTIESAAHVLASTSSIVGATGLSTIAREIEDTVRNGQLVDVGDLEQLATWAQRTEASLQHHFHTLKGRS